MRVSKRGAVLAAVTLAFGMAATACSDDGSDRDGAIVFTVEPENPLIPASTNEAGGSRIIQSAFRGLVQYDTESSDPSNANAESIETTDSQNYTIKLKEGWKFHDGTDVKAKNYVDAWNFAAYTPNAQQTGSFFYLVDGYDQVHTLDPDQDGPEQAPAPATDKMSGLTATDDLTLQVRLSEPSSIFPIMLGYNAFMPMPDMFFAPGGRESYEAKPVGNGPFKVTKKDTKGVEMERFGDYEGDDNAKVDTLTWRYYSNDLTAYRDIQSGKLDFMDQIPLSRLTSYKKDSDGRYNDKPVAVVQIINFPVYADQYADPRIRQAISMSVNREEIAKEVFDGTREPADGLVVPTTDGYQKNACGEFCEYKPDEARTLYAEAGGQAGARMEIWYNSDGPHKDWIEAVAGDISETLGVQCVAQPTEQFRDIRQKANAQEFTQLWRAGWQADYPHIENYLSPLYRTGGSSNDNGYTNPAVDAKLDEANRTIDNDAAVKLYQEAEKLVINDMPGIPAFFVKQQSIYSDQVKNVKVNWQGDVDVTQIEMK